MIRIITDSTSSIPKALREKLDICLLNLTVNHGGASYSEGEMDLDAFYSKIYEMIDDIPTSSQPSALAVETALEQAAVEGKEVLGIFISAKMSGVLESVIRAAREISERHPSFNYALIDSMTNCMELGWPVISACACRDAGGSLMDCVQAAKKTILLTRFLFVPESLRFLEKGGRIGRASALLGNVLRISPILTVQDGIATTFTKVRTQKKALQKIVDTFKHDIHEKGLANVTVHYIGFKDVAQAWATECVEPIVGREVMVTPASPVIGVHVGPAVGLVYECQEPLSAKLASTMPEIITA